VPFKGITRSQSLFSDLNRYARPPSKSMSLLFTHRESLARIAKSLCAAVPLLRDRVNMESTTLSRNARQFITLSTLYEMTKALLGRGFTKEDIDEQVAVERLANVWRVLVDAIPQWRLVADNEEHPAYLRARYLNMHGVCQQAIALAVARSRVTSPGGWEGAVRQTFGVIDWSLANPRWQGIALHAGRVNNTATSVRNLAADLEMQLGGLPEPQQEGAIR
jgi:DNA sulfur modification protein DndB